MTPTTDLSAATPLPPRTRLWSGRWIWPAGWSDEPNRYALFRCLFELDRVPERARLLITAESRYRMWINETPAGEGPPPSAPQHKYYDEHDVTPRLRKGRNCIAAVVHFTGNVFSSRGGLLTELVDGDGRVLTASGDGWRCLKCAAWEVETYRFRMDWFDPYQEMFDARRMPNGWTDTNFDDDDWDVPATLAGPISDVPPAVPPWRHLLPRDIPRMEERPVQAERVLKTEECTGLPNRIRREDLSICLSMPGQPVRHSSAEAVDSLCSEEGIAVMQTSTCHLEDPTFDGMYDPCVLLDFGRVLTAYFELDVDGPAGGQIEMGFAERLIDGHFNNSLEGQFAARFTLREGRQSWRLFSWRAFRYVKIRVRNMFSPVRIHQARAVLTRYPFADIGGFHSSDETLNQVFDLCRHTVRLCSHESIMDTPWREQGQWLGDVSAVTLGSIYACFGDTALTGKFLEQSASTQREDGLLANITNFRMPPDREDGIIPDYSLWWIHGLWNHYLYTGDPSWIRRYYPHVLKLVDAFDRHRDENGLLLNMPCMVLFDWADTDRRGECATLNAMFYGALGRVARMARLLSDTDTEAFCEQVRAGIRAAFKGCFWHEGHGCFVDASIDGELSEKISEHVNAAAVMWELADRATLEQVVDVVFDRRLVAATEAQPFFTTVVVQALDRIGRFDLAMRIVRQRWGKRMAERGYNSALEEWGENGSWRGGDYQGMMRTHSHAWSAHPAEFLIRNLIGLTILEPGCRRVSIAPPDVDFDYDVSYATPHGPVRVKCSGGQHDIEAPDGVMVER